MFAVAFIQSNAVPPKRRYKSMHTPKVFRQFIFAFYRVNFIKVFFCANNAVGIKARFVHCNFIQCSNFARVFFGNFAHAIQICIMQYFKCTISHIIVRNRICTPPTQCRIVKKIIRRIYRCFNAVDFYTRVHYFFPLDFYCKYYRRHNGDCSQNI